MTLQEAATAYRKEMIRAAKEKLDTGKRTDESIAACAAALFALQGAAMLADHDPETEAIMTAMPLPAPGVH
jgi:hypothetical protein